MKYGVFIWRSDFKLGYNGREQTKLRKCVGCGKFSIANLIAFHRVRRDFFHEQEGFKFWFCLEFEKLLPQFFVKKVVAAALFLGFEDKVMWVCNSSLVYLVDLCAVYAQVFERPDALEQVCHFSCICLVLCSSGKQCFIRKSLLELFECRQLVVDRRQFDRHRELQHFSRRPLVYVSIQTQIFVLLDRITCPVVDQSDFFLTKEESVTCLINASFPRNFRKGRSHRKHSVLELELSLHDLLVGCVTFDIFYNEQNPRSALVLWDTFPIEVQRLYKLYNLPVDLILTWIQNEVFFQSFVLACIKELVSTVTVGKIKVWAILIGDVFLQLVCTHSHRQHAASNRIKFD